MYLLISLRKYHIKVAPIYSRLNKSVLPQANFEKRLIISVCPYCRYSIDGTVYNYRRPQGLVKKKCGMKTLSGEFRNLPRRNPRRAGKANNRVPAAGGLQGIPGGHH
jgi:hypothetical protein